MIRLPLDQLRVRDHLFSRESALIVQVCRKVLLTHHDLSLALPLLSAPAQLNTLSALR